MTVKSWKIYTLHSFFDCYYVWRILQVQKWDKIKWKNQTKFSNQSKNTNVLKTKTLHFGLEYNSPNNTITIKQYTPK